MFTGIIEAIGRLQELAHEKGNLILTVESVISKELKIDQSVSHNGICLTVVEQNQAYHKVVAIAETLQKTNLSALKISEKINLERCMLMNSRLDGHLVQGHVDQKAECISIKETQGSWLFSFQYGSKSKEGTLRQNSNIPNITVEKGSITVNGVSLTVVNSLWNSFSVAIIPYTYENTNFNELRVGDFVNLEFDIIGKYIAKLMSLRQEEDYPKL